MLEVVLREPEDQVEVVLVVMAAVLPGQLIQVEAVVGKVTVAVVLELAELAWLLLRMWTLSMIYLR